MADSKEMIYDFYGKIIGSIVTKSDGDRIAYDFYGKILGRYSKTYNRTYDFYGKIVSTGDTTSALVWANYNKK